MSLSNKGFPGDGYMYVICDVCGKKVRQKDTVIRKDKYNQQNMLVVCLDDVDTPQPSLRPIHIRERYRPTPSSVRGEPADTYAVNANASRLPSAPQLLVAQTSGISETVALNWLGPSDPGDSSIIGYVIWRMVTTENTQEPTADPTGSVIVANTGNNSPYYEDTTLDIEGTATYKVAAINSSGTGPYSNEAYFPAYMDTPRIRFLQASDTDYYILTGDGVYIRVGT